MIPNRISGLQRLKAFVPSAGQAYARRRNFDFGPENRDNVSMLSPWLRYRLLTETEVLEAVLSAHSLDVAQKFVQEVCWRTYWKGWLEMRPEVWQAYRQDIISSRNALTTRGQDLYEQAMAGRTGIECFDAWCEELTSSGYLHNHARMWFASIWIFTLRLPWSLGADFFMQHLIDGDAASNTLSWRWVAGLQTLGKFYLAREDNIANFTDGRFPSTPGLSTQAHPLIENVQFETQPLPKVRALDDDVSSAWLIVDDDLTPEQFRTNTDIVEEAIILDTTAWRSTHRVGRHVADFVNGAVADTVQRLDVTGTRIAATPVADDWVDRLVDWCLEHNVKQLVSPYVPVGPTSDALRAATFGLNSAGLRVAQVQRDWDRTAWPYATKGFFPFKKHIPELLRVANIELREPVSG